MYISRQIEPILAKNINDKRKNIHIIYGARQTGKTTLLKHIVANEKALWLACDEATIARTLVPDSIQLRNVFDGHTLVVFDEMQLIPDAGQILKVIADHMPDVTAYVTGSSAFDLANKVSEPLTGRYYDYFLYPLAFSEVSRTVPTTDITFLIDQYLLYGSYPGVVAMPTITDKMGELTRLTDSYLYKDILTLDLIKDSINIRNLLVALALQIGSEVSYHELAKLVRLSYKTVERYIDLLEKSFVIFRLRAYAKNGRNELSRKVKIYFYDCGIRNALINNFNRIELRNDGGALFENFIIAERVKRESWQPQRTNMYFWRTYTQHEIDLVMEQNAVTAAVEIKSSTPAQVIQPKQFLTDYPQASFTILAKDQPFVVQDFLR